MRKLDQFIFKSEFLNDRNVIRLLKFILIVLAIFAFTQIAYLFQPIIDFMNFFAFPFIGTGIMYYLFSPLVVKLSRRGVNRHLSIWLIFIGLSLLITWGIATLVPIVQSQTRSFINDLPKYVAGIEDIFNKLPLLPDFNEVFPNLANQEGSIDLNGLIQQIQPLVTSTFGGLGSVIGTVSTVVTGLVTIPVLLYYLLLEGYKLFPKLLYYIPTRYRETTKTMIYQSHYQIGQYIRGQIIVAIIVGMIFAAGFSIIGLDYAITLGVLATFLNVIPYIGSVIAAIPALIIGLIASPFMFIKVLIVLGIEALVEGRLIQPQILSSNLKIHPITILIVLLGAGRLFGVTGVILGVPAFAVIKVIVTELYRIYRKHSDLYADDTNQSDHYFSKEQLIDMSLIDDGQDGLAAEDQVDKLLNSNQLLK
ncbi:AI-2E family transporter [Facklamia miroungae]|uniref:Predicted PurR-regulated permease PerM n=1 Tax=Facklamia miroungae TaxID=120956 RepID=A0A1G7QY22_9LACT|nr:AI-2E family transporter [Facklamia miroungae]NKZ29087.1 AI-2E family transporter [Facklamia miroungae]SDG02769.1 Predicted PurR-regulated permease PerM [Facklamia miroungae]